MTNEDLCAKKFEMGERVRMVDTQDYGTITGTSGGFTYNGGDYHYYVVNWDDPDNHSDRGWNHSLQKVTQKVEDVGPTPTNYMQGGFIADPIPLTKREELLDEAKRIITQDRNNTYGPPSQDFNRIANLLSALGFNFGSQEEPIQPHHVAMIQICLKLSRLTWSPDHKDNWLDTAGYAATGWEAFNG